MQGIKMFQRSRLFINKIKSYNLNSLNMHTESPLQGIRILDLTRIVAGPFCTMILGDLGAEVIKVEKPKSGDESRNWGPPFINNTSLSCYFASVNRNKKSICVNIQQDSGQMVIHDLIKKSDVLVENFVAGKLDKFNLGYEQIKKIAPHIIYCSITGFGLNGPYKNRPGYDVIAASMGGLLHITGPENGDPVKVGVAMTDLATGLYAHGAIMAALIKRSKSGYGQKIDCDLLSTQIASLINIGSNYLNAGIEGKRWGTAHESIVPYETFKTKDGYYTIGAGSDEMFQKLCIKIGLPKLAENPKFKSNANRIINRRELLDALKNVIVKKTNSEWMQIFSDANFPNGPVNSLKDTFENNHVKETALVKVLKHPVFGEVKVVGPPVHYSDGGNFVRSPPPLLGEHTDEILSKILGYNEEHILKLKSAEIVQ